MIAENDIAIMSNMTGYLLKINAERNIEPNLELSSAMALS